MPDVLIGVQVREEGIVLKDDVEAPLLHRCMGDILAAVFDGAAIAFQDAEDDVEQRGFAAAGGTEDRDDLAVLDGKVDAPARRQNSWSRP